jgi:glycyl-tRNA synthetase beta chain
MPELLIELFCEEIPARMQARGAEDFARLMTEACAAEGLALTNPIAHHGPRRITLAAEAPAATEAVRIEQRGPRADAPEPVVHAWKAKQVAFSFEIRDTPKGRYWFSILDKPAILGANVISEVLPNTLRNLPWPKSMRWGGAGNFTFARPLRRILCLFDGRVVPLADAPAGLAATDVTEGHRFLAPAQIRVESNSHYVRALRKARVVVDAAERRRLILERAETVAREAGLRLVPDDGLLDEVTGLVEWPCPMLGRIDAGFMDLPPEVLRTSMRVNQRYFACVHPDGSPAPHFVVISNVPGSDGGGVIVAGNERVLRARFSDARFFWDQDRRQTLEAFLPKLETVVFHAKLGTQAQRVARLEVLAERIAPLVGADPVLARRAARLAKADLAAGMVSEFPELQGLMGSYYARATEGDAVADAIRDHYAPRGPNDAVPTAPMTIAVALADKLDQLAGFFAVGEKPTGSGDPFGLRRAALGVIRLVRENGLRLNLSRLLSSEVCDFLAERLRVQLRAEGKRHDIVAAVLARTSTSHPHPVPLPEGEGTLTGGALRERSPLPQGEGQGEGDANSPPAEAHAFDLVLLLARADALERMLATEDGANLLAGYTRAANILRIEEKRDGRSFPGTINPGLLGDPAETALAQALDQAARTITPALESENFAAAMAAMASLRHPIDTFFDQVTVNAPETELRENRLNLLAKLRTTFNQVADFQKIEG